MYKKIFISVGPHKTGSTFLEVEIFPAFSNINNIWKDKSDSFTDMLKINTYNKSSIVNEGLCGHYLFEYKGRKEVIKNLKTLFPDASIILSYRRHIKYISSMYAGYVTAGGSLKVSEFINFKEYSFIGVDNTSFKSMYLDLNEHFNNIFVFNIDDVNKNKRKFINNLSEFIEEDAPDLELIKWDAVNKSLPFTLLNIQRIINTVVEPKYDNLKPKRNYLNLPLRKVFFFRSSIYHHIISLIKIIPVKKKDLFDKKTASHIESYFERDLHYIKGVDSVL